MGPEVWERVWPIDEEAGLTGPAAEAGGLALPDLLRWISIAPGLDGRPASSR